MLPRLVFLAALLAAEAAAAQQSMETVTIVGTSPLPDEGIALERLPESVSSFTAADLSREGRASLAAALSDQAAGISINDNLDDPYQPDILYHGFEASPVIGTPEGLAVYQSGVRVNDAFGDTVDWDLIPDMAIARADLLETNPVYGLNALGGAIAIGMKNGFDNAGAEVEATGGSWGERGASLQYGASDGRFGIYGAGRVEAENGWRQFSPDRLNQFYGDAAYRANRLSIDLGVTLADNRLDGESATPVQELAVGRNLVFTHPQSTRDQLVFPVLNAQWSLRGGASVQANLYFRDFQQDVVNGNTTEYTQCLSDATYLCEPDGTTTLDDLSGTAIQVTSANPLGEIDFQSIHSEGAGGTLALNDEVAIFDRANHLTTGFSFDRNAIVFGSHSEIGAIGPGLAVLPSGDVVSQPEGTGWTATPVALGATDRYFGIFAMDSLNVTPDFAVTASGRYNLALIDLNDRRGSALSGHSRFARFNPAIGAIYTPDSISYYLDYAEGNRVPTPGEIECADPAAPCLLPSSLSSDPPTLKQVVSRNWELGARGAFFSGRVQVQASLFRTDLADDIYGVATSLDTAYFRNVGATRRQGADLTVSTTVDRLTASFSYSYVEATFETTFLLPSPFNAGADPDGDVSVRPGDTMPGIPRQRLKLNADYRLTGLWSVGATVVAQSGQYFRGDESNQMKPLPGYVVVNLRTSYAFDPRVSLFVDVTNALDARYATFGILGDPTGIGAPGVPDGAGADDRFESPAAPRSVVAGLTVKV